MGGHSSSVNRPNSNSKLQLSGSRGIKGSFVRMLFLLVVFFQQPPVFPEVWIMAVKAFARFYVVRDAHGLLVRMTISADIFGVAEQDTGIPALMRGVAGITVSLCCSGVKPQP